MKKDKIIALLKSGKYIEVTESEAKNIWRKSEYFLLPVTEFQISSFILIEPRKYVDFTSVEISYQLCVDYREVYTEFHNITMLNKKSVTFTSIIAFYNFLHSLDLIQYYNEILTNEYHDTVRRLEVWKLMIEIYNKDKLIYYNAIQGKLESDEIYNGVAKMEVLLRDNGVYIYGNNVRYYTFDKSSMKWKVHRERELKEENIMEMDEFDHEAYGIFHVESNSVFIVNASILKDLYYIEFMRIELHLLIVNKSNYIEDILHFQSDHIGIEYILSIFEMNKMIIYYNNLLGESSYDVYSVYGETSGIKYSSCIEYEFHMKNCCKIEGSGYRYTSYLDDTCPVIYTYFTYLQKLKKGENEDELYNEEE